MKKNTLFCLFLTLLLPFVARTQSNDYYIQLEDASGFNTAPYQDSLEAHAYTLIQALPDTFRNLFRVYDFGFYQHHEVTSGYPDAFEKKKAEVAALTPYYLLFGKQTDKTGVYTKIWVSTNLPSFGTCLTNAKLREIEFFIGNVLLFSHDKTYYFNYHNSEIASIDSLRIVLNKVNTCCLSNDNNCKINSCYSIDYILEMLSLKKFRSIPIEIGNPIFAKSSIVFSENIVDSARLKVVIKGEIVDLAEGMQSILEMSGENYRCFITKNENICPGNYFAIAESDFLQQGQYAATIWFHILESSPSSLFIKWIDNGNDDPNPFGLEMLFHQQDFIPYVGDQQNQQNNGQRIITLNNNGFITTIAPRRDYSSPGTVNTLNRTPTIKTHTNETITLNDPIIDDDLISGYYDHLIHSPDTEITLPQEKIALQLNGIDVDCYRGSNPTCKLYCNNNQFFFNYNYQSVKPFYEDGGIERKGYLSRLYFAKSNSPNCGKMDYWCRYLISSYRTGSLPCYHQSFLMEDERISPYYRYGSMSTAFNLKDFGNFLWGGAMQRLGFSLEDALYWASFNEKVGTGQDDAEADKRAIKSGYENIIGN